MSEDIIVKHCSPTLAGMKTGNLFSCPFADEEEMRYSVRQWNRTLVCKGLRVLPLKFKDNRALVYVYRVSSLSRDLKDDAVRRLLKEKGYETEAPELCIVRLIRKLEGCDEFPHEIGLFLGYPPEDVSGFIENGAEGYKLVGYWKVYGNEEKARLTFARYKKCTDVYTAQFAKDKSIERLTVAG
ncbi:MAG: DUF3793 family protein [Butyrivibrio sp.]|nr:DUF3793 family protein [Muribaculum sp.]MCM1553782.1 DUF3793 family protein [Butyrivibrio sp.]